MTELLTALFIAWPLIYGVIAVHEIGHFVPAFVLGQPVTRVEIGEGPRLSFFWRGICFRFGILPWGGKCVRAWPSKVRWKNATVTAGGPTANFICGVLAWRVAHDFAAVSIVMGVLNLVPRNGSDGQKLLQEIRRDRAGRLVR